MKLNKVLEILLEAKEKFGEDIEVYVSDEETWTSKVDEIFSLESELFIGSNNGCDYSKSEFYRK